MIKFNPTREDILEMIAAAESTNKGYRQRTCYFPDDLPDRIMAEESGLVQLDGGGVASSYGSTTRTTVLGAAWGTWPDGTKVVKIEGGQYRCSGPHVTPIWRANAKLRDLLPSL